jgi:hypothetical protein
LRQFESHAIAVTDDLNGCERSWTELLGLGVPQSHLGLVAGAVVLERARASTERSPADSRRAARETHCVCFARCAIEMVPIVNGDAGPEVYASRDYPSRMIARAAEQPGRGVAAPFAGLMPERDGAALEAAISRGDALIWVRSCDPEAASRVANLLLRRSTQRVRTFTRISDD